MNRKLLNELIVILNSAIKMEIYTLNEYNTKIKDNFFYLYVLYLMKQKTPNANKNSKIK